MTKKDPKLKEKIDELIANSDYFIASPETIAQMQSTGEPIREVVIPYKKYLDDLFEKRRKVADELVLQLPHLNKQIANGSVAQLYEELKECFVMGIPGASIVLAILLLDLSAKLRLFKERKKVEPESKWDPIEDMHLREVILELRDHGSISDKEEERLLIFNKEVRNNYLHYNIQKLVKDMLIAELPSINFQTGELKIEYNVKPAERPELWFSAKKVLDRKSLVIRVTFCLEFVNLILTRDSISVKRNRKKEYSFFQSMLKDILNGTIRRLKKIEKKI